MCEEKRCETGRDAIVEFGTEMRQTPLFFSPRGTGRENEEGATVPIYWGKGGRQ
jgi:hypothetical protein